MHFFVIVLAPAPRGTTPGFDNILDLAENLIVRFHGGEGFLEAARKTPPHSEFGEWFRRYWRESQFCAYYLGLRWNGVITGEYRPMGHPANESEEEAWWQERHRRNVTPVASYLKVLDGDDDAFPCAIVTPDAEWIERDHEARFDGDPHKRDQWKETVRGILHEHRDCYAVGFDCKA